MSVFSASVIIPAFRNLNDLRACIEALSRQDTLESYEIIVVSDAPDSDVRALLDSCNTERSVTYLYNSSRSGPAAARNLGARMALGDVLCFTEDDCVPDAHWLDGGIKLLRETGSDVVWGVLNGSTGKPSFRPIFL
jgi:glycosyltransferase involved in cell wall biosynthesis